MQYWTIRIGVDDCWVEDGFDFTEQYCENVGQKLRRRWHTAEVPVTVLSAPDPTVIKKLQGYT